MPRNDPAVQCLRCSLVYSTWSWGDGCPHCGLTTVKHLRRRLTTNEQRTADRLFIAQMRAAKCPAP